MHDQSLNQPQISEASINTPPLIYRIKEYRAPSLLSQFSYMLIRPPRFLYNEQLLYPPENYQVRYKVTHYEIPFRLTLYMPENVLYVVLYLHGNSSSRFEGYMNLKDLPDGVGLACFDFNGCGNRFENQYITLGSKESKDVDIAARFLKGLGCRVVGWGRSMGSVSLLLSDEIDIMVADSPFHSLVGLCEEISYKATPSACCCFFHCLYPCLFSCVRSDVEQRAGFDMRELEIGKKLAQNPRSKDKALFIMAATGDSMINYSHSQKIYEAFPGKKQIELFEGNHNSNRPDAVLNKCYEFIQKQLGVVRKVVAHKKFPNIRLKPIKQQNLKSMSLQKSKIEQPNWQNNDDQNREDTEPNGISKIGSDIRLTEKQSTLSPHKDIKELLKPQQRQKEEQEPTKNTVQTTIQFTQLEKNIASPGKQVKKQQIRLSPLASHPKIVIKPQKSPRTAEHINNTSKTMLQK